MKTTLIREDFLKAILITNRFVPLKPSIPVLGNILLKIDKSSVLISATNLESSVRLKLAAKSEGEWAITTPAKILNDFVSSAYDKEITLELDKDNLLISSGEVKGTLAGIAASEFPKIPETTEKGIEFKLPEIQEAVTSVAFAASADEGKPILTGVYLNEEGDKTMIVATDGFRLAKKMLEKKYPFNQVVLPAKNLVESLRVVGEMGESEVSLILAKDQNQVLLKGETFEISSRLLDGTYPKFQQIIPQNFVTTVTIDKAKFAAAIKATAVFARDLGNVVKLDIKSGVLTLSANTAQIGEGSATLNVETDGEDLKVAFNSKFLLDGLSTIKSDTIVARFSGSLSPAIINSQGETTFEYIVMPVKSQT